MDGVESEDAEDGGRVLEDDAGDSGGDDSVLVDGVDGVDVDDDDEETNNG